MATELLLGLTFFLLLLLFPFAAPAREVPLSSCSAQIEAVSEKRNSSGLYLTLHHPRSPCSPAADLRNLPFSEVLHHESRRVASLSHRLQRGATAATATTAAVSVPLTQGTALGVGNYIARIGLGTPAKFASVIVDTGSSLSWVQCSPCKMSCHKQRDPIFNPAASSTYRPLPCSATECSELQSATLNPSACSRSATCIYEATYGDSSFSLGYLSKDKLSFSGSGALAGFTFGCGEDNEGLFGETAGIVGLAKNKLSLLSQIAPVYGNSFSYCLPTSSGVGFVSFGGYRSSEFSFTPMATSSLDKTLYFLKLTGITVARKSLAVSESVYAGTPTIIDSGTVITRLPEAAYAALSKAVVAAIGGKRPRAPPYSILDTCYRGIVAGLPVPEVELVFAGGATVRLSARNVMIDVKGGTTCLAFAAAGGVAIIGNRQQQTFKVVYDVGSQKIGFAANGCG
ncbi:Protein aspartic protease in guard cell 1 [Apostasia shenzhenica]|uniref:Protein aspartic protease in guard cell 1 n=1 Tax=Apostasia shenzhenica TaxID=1088818 RepID=A0A2I0A737_9ASPA|nr:Protein aspartic protease in guard cell 1 [Apostasia shenzhenica]